MRERLMIERTLAAPADAVWEAISHGSRVERWFEFVAFTELRDGREGGSRVIHLKDGSSFDEFITLNDDRTRTYQYYAPHPPFPIEHVIGTKRIVTCDDGTVVATWLVGFGKKDGAPADIGETMRGLYERALAAIERVASGRRG